MLNHYITKMTGVLETWIIHLSFIRFYTVIQGVYSFLYSQTHIPICNVFSPKSNQILQYGTILQYTQTQYAIQYWLVFFHPYCLCCEVFYTTYYSNWYLPKPTTCYVYDLVYVAIMCFMLYACWAFSSILIWQYYLLKSVMHNSYRIASNYGRSRINAGCQLVAWV